MSRQWSRALVLRFPLEWLLRLGDLKGYVGADRCSEVVD